MVASRTYPTEFGPFRILAEVARGGMAEVSLALHDRQVVALKRMLPELAADPGMRSLFETEIALTGCFDHPGVVRVAGSGEVGSTPYLALEYVHGRALNQVLHALTQRARRLPLPHAAYVALHVAEALEHVHRARDSRGRPLEVVLCDLSPGNVLLGWDGTVRLVDFGIAQSRLHFREQIGLLKGKKSYMAPEQLLGRPLDARADLFALGLTLTELFTARPAFAGRTEFEVEEAVRKGALDPVWKALEPLPPALRETLWGAMSHAPGDRCASAGQLAIALEGHARKGRGEQVTPADLAALLGAYLPELKAEDEARLAAAREGGF